MVFTGINANHLFNLVGLTDPKFSKMKLKVPQKNQICFCKTINIVQLCHSNKEEAL